MKSGKVAVGLAAVVVISGLAFAFVREGSAEGEARPPAAPTASAGAGVVQVDDLAENPDAFRGEIRLRAAVARVKKAEGVFAGIDAREFEECGSVTCAKHYLPVRYGGDLPAVKTVVELVGEVVHTDKGLVFEAKRLEAR